MARLPGAARACQHGRCERRVLRRRLRLQASARRGPPGFAAGRVRLPHGNPPGDDERENEGKQPLHISIMKFADEPVKQVRIGTLLARATRQSRLPPEQVR